MWIFLRVRRASGAVPGPETPFGPVLQPVWRCFQNKKQYSRKACCISKAAAPRRLKSRGLKMIIYFMRLKFNWMSPRENRLSSRSV